MSTDVWRSARAARMTRRLRCPRCGEPTTVNSDGTFRRHPQGVPPAARCPGTGAQAGPAAARVLSWDWKGQPDLRKLAAAVHEISAGTVFIREIDTGGDFYMLVIADHQVTDEEAEGLHVS